MNPTSTPMRRRSRLATRALAALLGMCVASGALASAALVRVEVLDRDNGETLRVWHDHGRPVIAGRPGDRYAVRLVNTSGERVLAVVAIDGVNVVSGETASVGQRGYVLAPWQRTEITGWRKSDNEVAAFEFTALSDSYAARTGRPLDVGVIGVAVFREASRLDVSSEGVVPTTPAPAPTPPFGLDAMRKASPSVAPNAAADMAAAPGGPSRRAAAEPPAGPLAGAGRYLPPAPAERLGTGHGARETSVARVTSFERASSQPEQRIEIRYDSLDNLVAAGIVPPPPVASAPPHPFPGDPARDYVPDPPRR